MACANKCRVLVGNTCDAHARVLYEVYLLIFYG